MDKPDKKKNRSYRLSLQDAISHERIWGLRFSHRTMVAALVTGGVLVVLILFCLIAFTPVRLLIPGYPNAASRREAAQTAQRIDSLETKILQWELYSENLRRIASGEDPIQLDSVALAGTVVHEGKIDSAFLAYRDSLLRADVTAEEQFGVDDAAALRRRNLSIEAQSFYTPVKGVVSEGFDLAVHPWIDVTAPAGSVVMSVLDGTVVYTGWEEDNGYVLAIQHTSDILSIYKHNEKLLRKAGESVKAGMPVGVLASSVSLTKGDHLHFELWYEGTAVDPVQYIKF
ncbi:MAG: M23 family metallopeptidase [Bacteroidales bacterium]|nr:M23 family metallopeptidase [Bacteroidales bacterium]